MGGGRGMSTQAKFSTTAAQTCGSPCLGARQFMPCGSADITILANICLDSVVQAEFLQDGLANFRQSWSRRASIHSAWSAGITVLAKFGTDFKLRFQVAGKIFSTTAAQTCASHIQS